ncbi:MAG: site-2 protease family protein [Deltaproteobacteria bacterium]
MENRRMLKEYGLPLLLFLATVMTTVVAGAFYEGADPLHDAKALLKGLPFSMSLIFILGSHELGHYFAGRSHGVVSTLPHFIPAPPVPPMIGTFGAVIRMKSPILTRKALVDIGASGPLIGFMAAIIVTCIGLSGVSVLPVSSAPDSLELGTPLVFKALSYIVLGPVPDGYDISLNAVTFAGWIGFFVTSINLLPIGQLDGGHISYALTTRRHRAFSFAAVAILVALGIYGWLGWLVWGALIVAFGLAHPPVENPSEPLGRSRTFVAVAAIAVFVLTFTPTPFYIK